MSALPLHLVCAVLAGMALTAGAARVSPDDVAPPKPLTLRLTDPYLTMEVERDESLTDLPGSPTTTDETTDFTPGIGFGLEGSIYHARLLQFNASVELGVTRGERTQDDGAGNTTHDSRAFDLQRYNASVTLLRAKPYSLTLFARKDREQRDYDQFNRFQVDHESYGARVRHTGLNFNWDMRLAHTTEDTTNTDQPTHDEETLFTYDARYRRTENNGTTLRYSNRNFNRQDDNAAAYSGVQQTLYLLDEAYFSEDRQSRLLSSLNYTDLDETNLGNRTLTLREDYRRRRRANLWNGATYQHDRQESGGTTSDVDNGELYVEHRLYESLNSRLDAQVEDGRSHGGGSSDDYLRYGPGVSEHYTKQLSDFGNLGLGLDYRLDRIKRETSGTTQNTINEHLTLVDGTPALLSQPNVQQDTIAVTDVSGTRRYVEGFDYTVVSRGAYTEIQRVFGGAIPNGSTVSVDYTSTASGSDSLYRSDGRVTFELDLYDRLVFLYGNQHDVLHAGTDTLVYQDYRETVAGVKCRWAWFEVGLEHVDYKSDALSYQGPNYYAEATLEREDTTVKLHAGRSDITYSDQQGKLDTRMYTATYDWHPASVFSLQAFAGDYHETSQDGKRDLISLEGRMVFAFSQLTVEGTYRYEDEDSSDEKHGRRYFLLRIKRAL